MTDPKEIRERPAQEAQLERLIGDVLRHQPMRRAPVSLEARVLASIAETEDAPWWRTGFSNWPMAARLAFLVVLLGVAKLTLDLAVWLFSGPTPVTHTVESSVTWARSTANLFSTLISIGHALLSTIPSHWITLALVFAAGMYFMLFALGATAYRTLYMNK
jgi:hypothetical protein